MAAMLTSNKISLCIKVTSDNKIVLFHVVVLYYHNNTLDVHHLEENNGLPLIVAGDDSVFGSLESTGKLQYNHLAYITLILITS